MILDVYTSTALLSILNLFSYFLWFFSFDCINDNARRYISKQLSFIFLLFRWFLELRFFRFLLNIFFVTLDRNIFDLLFRLSFFHCLFYRLLLLPIFFNYFCLIPLYFLVFLNFLNFLNYFCTILSFYD